MSAYGKPQPSQLQGYENGRTYPESSFPYVSPSYGSQSSVPSAISAPVFQNAAQMPQIAYSSGNSRAPYEDQAGAYLNVGSGPAPEVISFAPTSGSAGITLSVEITTLYELTNAPIFYLIVGQKRCPTSCVKQSQSGAVCQYSVSSTIPDFTGTNWSSAQVPLFLHMESRDGDMLARVEVGSFTYTDGGSQSEHTHDGTRKRKISSESAELMKSPAKRNSRQQLRPKEEYSPYGYTPTEGVPPFSPYLQPSHSYNSLVPQYNRSSGNYQTHPSPRNIPYGYSGSSTASPPNLKAQSPHVGSWSPSYSTIPSSNSRSPGISSNMGMPRPGLTSVPSATVATPQLIRTSTLAQTTSPVPTTHGGHPFNAYAMYPNKAKLEIQGNLDTMLEDHWSAEEWDNKRRIVQFFRVQSGSTITASFKPFSADDRPSNSIVISCIYWAEKNNCYVTSVDTIHLLEQLVAVRFTVEEKNRIRRNLEGFRPLTVSKGKPESEEFFKIIMAFPAPKPRNIEKDVKVFAWKDLGPALKKIIGKYSASPATTLPPGPALLTPVSSTGYVTEGSSTGISYASDHHAAISPRSVAGSTTSTAYSSNLPVARTISPHNQKSMPGHHDLRVAVPHAAHEAANHWPGSQHHMSSSQHYSQQLGNASGRSTWDNYLENNPATAVGTSAPQTVNYQSSRNVADPANPNSDNRIARSVSSQQSHQMPRT